MDIIDIILARALSPQSSVETIVQRASAAMTAAETAVSSAETAVTAAEEALSNASNAAAASYGAAKALVPYNAFDLVALQNKSDATHNGITYTWDENGSCAVTGTSSSQSVNVIYSNTSILPLGVYQGMTYKVSYSSTNVNFQVRFYVNGAWSAVYDSKTNGSFTVPTGATGMLMRLTVLTENVTVDETVTPIVRYALSNIELEERINNECFITHGLVDSNTDINNIKASGYYILAGSRGYDNTPIPSPIGAAAVLEVFAASQNVILQRITLRGDDQKVWYRCTADGSFTYEDAGILKTCKWNEIAPYDLIKAYIDGIKEELEEEIANIPSGGGGGHIGEEYAGRVVVIDENGDITWSAVFEQAIIDALIKSGDYTIENAVELTIDYVNKTFSRNSTESNLDNFTMYGGRMRCNVSDNGTINAFYGDAGYTEDGSNGQVMVYQPKFYYKRTIIESVDVSPAGKAINKESLIISPIAQTGFKIHPLFINEDGQEVDYVLLSAYEGSAYLTSSSTYDLIDSSSVNASTDKLSSIAGAKPISGINKTFTIETAEQMATNRGTGWHITNMAFESASQMLMSNEFGTFNGQTALELGICKASNNNSYNCAFITGSTASLGNATGHAASSVQEINGTSTSWADNGKRAISYRGLENPWGDTWRMIGGVNMYGNGSLGGGMAYICKDFDYDTSSNANYESVNFCLPSLVNWITRFGYGDSKYDWIFMPATCDSTANSALPVGDHLVVSPSLNGMRVLACGGPWNYEESDGMFYYAADKSSNFSGRSYNARLMFIPTKDSIYTSNIEKWTAKRGG